MAQWVMVALGKLEGLAGSLGTMWRKERTHSCRLASGLSISCGMVSVSVSLSLMHVLTILYSSLELLRILT